MMSEVIAMIRSEDLTKIVRCIAEMCSRVEDMLNASPSGSYEFAYPESDNPTEVHIVDKSTWRGVKYYVEYRGYTWEDLPPHATDQPGTRPVRITRGRRAEE